MKPFALRIHLATVFILLVTIIGGVIGWSALRHTRDILRESIDQLSAQIDGRVRAEMVHRREKAASALALLAAMPELAAQGLPERAGAFVAMRSALAQVPATVAVFVGNRDGDFVLLRRLRDAEDRQFFDMPERAALVVQRIDRAAGVSEFLYLDDEGHEVLRRPRPQALEYDPRTRPWYQSAQAGEAVVETAPYRFYTTGRIGSTLALRYDQGRAVVAIDLRLDDLSAVLAELRPTPGARLALVDAQGQVLVTDLSAPAAATVFTPLVARAAGAGSSGPIEVAGQRWLASLEPVAAAGAPRIDLALMIPEADILQDARRLVQQQTLLVVGLLLLGLLAGLWFARRLSGTLGRLAHRADAVRHFDFSAHPEDNVRSTILEVDILARSLIQMRTTIAQFLDITGKLAGEEQVERLLPDLLGRTMDTARAEAGVLYLLDASSGALRPVAAQRAGAAVDPATLSTLAADDAPLGLAVALAEARVVGVGLAGDAVARASGFDALPARGHGLAVPLINRQGVRLGALWLGSEEAFDRARSRFVEYLSGFASVSLETRELISAQKALFDAFVRLIAHAIDTKSPYTGGHCMRVPELARLLAEAACRETEGPFADFALDDKDWEAVNLASWLHDCGKVTTPEFVVDKATRLETLHDRIHEVRTRFEVRKRECEVACWQAIADGADREAEQARLAAAWAQLDADFAFVAECNSGATVMDDARLARLRRIAAQTWTRTLDDRLGTGPEEAARQAAVPAPTFLGS